MVLVLAGMSVQFFVFANEARRSGDITWVLGVPTAPFWFVIDGLLWIAMACQFIVLARDVVGADRRKVSPPVLQRGHA